MPIKWCIARHKNNKIALALLIDGKAQDLTWIAVETKVEAEELENKYWRWQTSPCPFLPAPVVGEVESERRAAYG